ncbi:MAG: lysophospholipid acyltransferase family protein [Candidatus Rokuibacteriota bacterium]
MRTPLLDLARPGIRGFCRLYFGLELRGTEHIPPAGPLLITPNHQTFADPPLVSIAIRYPVHYMAWDRLFRIPVFGWLIRQLRAFPVDIDTNDRRATREAIRLLRAGHALMIFPEAGRTRDGAVASFRPGAFRIAVAHRVPVLPVTIAGGHDAWPPGRLLPRPGRIRITYHPVQRAASDLPPRDAAHQLAERTRQLIVTALDGLPAPRRR